MQIPITGNRIPIGHKITKDGLSLQLEAISKVPISKCVRIKGISWSHEQLRKVFGTFVNTLVVTERQLFTVW